MLHQVGVGTLGPVFRTYEPTRDRLVAVKVFRLDITPEQAQSLADELTRAAEAGLFHPSIVEPIAAGVQGTVAYRADEYVAAESLDVAMRHYAPAALDKVLPFITQLAGAIDFARAAGVGHGALHPRDIFVTPDEARATGFGVVDALERVGLRAPIRRPYSAPERIDGQPWGVPADVFSLAAIAFELLTGRRPSGLGDQIGTLAGASVGNQADALHTVLARAMSESPDDRFPTALAFASALEGAARPGASPSEFAPSKPATVAPVIPLAAQLPAREEALSVQPPVIEENVVVENDDDVVEVARDDDVASAALGVAGVELDDDAGDRDVVEVDEERDVEVDDIAAEREEDEAHWSLTQAEQQAPPSAPEADPTRMFDDEQTEAGRDRLVFDAVDLTLGDEHPIDRRFNYEFIDPPNTVTPLDERADEPPPLPPPVVPLAPEPPIRPVHEARRRARPIVVPPRTIEPEPEPEPEPVVPPLVRVQEPIERVGSLGIERTEAWERPEPERSGSPILPIAIALIPAMLLSFAAGYFVRGRGDTPQATQSAAPATQTAEATTPASPPPGPPAKPFSEQTVTPPPATTATPPAAAPSVPGDVPAPGPGTTPKTETARPAPATPATGKLQVRSNPSGASVTLNGAWRGRTPLTLDALAFGNYEVRVVSPGYDVAREDVTLSSAAASGNISVRLQRQRTVAATKPAPPRQQAPPARSTTPSAAPSTPTRPTSPLTGSVYVDSRPRGAKVFIDGKEIGNTPIQIPEVRIGSHVIRLQLADHRIWANSVSVSAGKESRVSGSLEPIVRNEPRDEDLRLVSGEPHHGLGALQARPAGAERGEGVPASDGVGGSGGAKPPGQIR